MIVNKIIVIGKKDIVFNIIVLQFRIRQHVKRQLIVPGRIILALYLVNVQTMQDINKAIAIYMDLDVQLQQNL